MTITTACIHFTFRKPFWGGVCEGGLNSRLVWILGKQRFLMYNLMFYKDYFWVHSNCLQTHQKKGISPIINDCELTIRLLGIDPYCHSQNIFIIPTRTFYLIRPYLTGQQASDCIGLRLWSFLYPPPKYWDYT